MGAAIADLHRAHDVDLRLGEGVEAIEGTDSVERVRLGGGAVIEADVVVVGIGVVPNTSWLDGSGLPVDDGVVADATCSVAPASWRAATWPAGTAPATARCASSTGTTPPTWAGPPAGVCCTGDDEAEAYDPVPWFWSDQYDVRIQMAGPGRRRDGGHRRVRSTTGRFVALYGRDGRVQGALGWNWPAKTVRYRMALEAGLAWADAVG